MFRILSETRFDFMGKRNVLLAFSALLVLGAVGVLVIHGIELGVEFSGGTELQVKFAETPDVGEIRSVLARAGMANAKVTSIGDVSENEVYIQLPLASDQEEQGDVMRTVLDALTGDQAVILEAQGQPNLNKVDSQQLAQHLTTYDGVTPGQAEALAAAILERRSEVALLRSTDDLAGVPGLTPEILEQLERRTFFGPFALRSQSFIGPAIGAEMVQKATWAIVGSLAGMLIYIWVRFELQWGLAAVVALTHDAVITLGLFSIFGKEMSLPVVAAFLTLIGYSVNDTVVVFDRIRENLRLKGATQALTSVINLSINQTLSRTVITSGLTLVVVLALLIFGGKALNPFAFVLVVGVLVGTYSSIYVASPILLVWRQLRRSKGRSKSGAAARSAGKLRSS